ncbi:hypothetical protein [Pantoea agglomerans]|uniref:hypothetical protein n=1 Tax=Enterobacter agglomerans TaxID=549 RepID=UPI002412E841|nr:hypothetical protein [Pantoea agglomerans]
MSKAKMLVCTVLLLLINYNVYAAYDGKKQEELILHEVSLYKDKDLVFRGSQQTRAGESAYFNLENGLNNVNVSILIKSDIINRSLLSDIKATYSPAESKEFFGFNKDNKLYFMSGENRKLMLCKNNIFCANSEYQLMVRETIKESSHGKEN